jgi:cyanophycinase
MHKRPWSKGQLVAGLTFRVASFLAVFSILSAADVAVAQSDDSASERTGSLVICGGGELPEEALDRFVELACGEQGKLVVIPTAGTDKGIADQAATIEQWTARGIGSVTVLHTRDRDVADSEEFVKPLEDATAVWFRGGQQSRLAEAYVGTATETAILEVFRRGGVIGGTSAGAAIQSRVMIQSGNPVPKITTGFDLLPGVIIDQHFLYRNRFTRLQTAIRNHPDRIGVGIDEDTAVLFCQGQCHVLGDSYVTLITTAEKPVSFSVRTVRSGQTFELQKVEPSNCRTDCQSVPACNVDRGRTDCPSY